MQVPGSKQLPAAARSHICRSLQTQPTPFGLSNEQKNNLYDRRSFISLLATIQACIFNRPAEAVLIQDVTPAVAPPAQLTSREQQIVDIFDRCNPSVVNIYDSTLSGRLNSGPTGVEQPEGNGSGFIFDTSGHVVTNYHVLTNSLRGATGGTLKSMTKVATVYLLGMMLLKLLNFTAIGMHDVSRQRRPVTSKTDSCPRFPRRASNPFTDVDGYQRAFDGMLVGADKSRDLVVLKVEAPSSMLCPLPLGNSNSLRIGQTVICIGNPFGFDHTLTVGVVSALDRGFQSQTGSTIGGGIQTDAALNPGNSGGPLLDLSGRVIGINTAIFTNTGTSAGVGFAIPVSIVSKVVPQLIQDGNVVRASLGVHPAPEPVAHALNVTQGVLIQSMEPNGPAAQAGLLATRRGLTGVIAGDVIVRVGQSRIRNVFDLSLVLDEAQVGDVVEVEIVRGVGGEESSSQKLRVNATLTAE